MDCNEKIKIVRKAIEDGVSNGLEELLLEHFPEAAAESEDERIRKEIVSFIKSVNHSYLCGTDRRTKWLTYLEKQKEQKPLLPEDKVKHPLYVECFEAGKEVGRQCEKVFEKQKEQKPNLLPGFDRLSPDEEMSHPLFLKGFDVGRKVGHIEAGHTPSPEETELNSVAFLEQLGYTCIPPSERKSAELSEADLEKEIRDWCNNVITGYDPIYTGSSLRYSMLPECANHFYELGRKSGKPVEWSEEDELMFHRIYETLGAAYTVSILDAESCHNMKCWLLVKSYSARQTKEEHGTD